MYVLFTTDAPAGAWVDIPIYTHDTPPFPSSLSPLAHQAALEDILLDAQGFLGMWTLFLWYVRPKHIHHHTGPCGSNPSFKRHPSTGPSSNTNSPSFLTPTPAPKNTHANHLKTTPSFLTHTNTCARVHLLKTTASRAPSRSWRSRRRAPATHASTRTPRHVSCVHACMHADGWMHLNGCLLAWAPNKPKALDGLSCGAWPPPSPHA